MFHALNNTNRGRGNYILARSSYLYLCSSLVSINKWLVRYFLCASCRHRVTIHHKICLICIFVFHSFLASYFPFIVTFAARQWGRMVSSQTPTLSQDNISCSVRVTAAFNTYSREILSCVHFCSLTSSFHYEDHLHSQSTVLLCVTASYLQFP